MHLFTTTLPCRVLISLILFLTATAYADAVTTVDIGRLVAYKTALAAVCPADPYWYLGVLATHPTRQGEGLATAVLTPVLGEADRDGLACCLETSTETNRRFYERRGFIEPTAVELPAGPPTWWLHRPAGPKDARIEMRPHTGS